MALILDGLMDPDSWVDLWNGELYATPVDLPLDNPKAQFIRIPHQTCPVIVEESVLIFEARSIYALQHWSTAGYINQLVPTGIGLGNQAKYQAYRKRVTLGNPQLIFLPVLGRDKVSTIELMVPKWLKHIEWNMKGYTGQISTSELSAIANVRGTQLTIIERLHQLNYQMTLIDQNTSYW